MKKHDFEIFRDKVDRIIRLENWPHCVTCRTRIRVGCAHEFTARAAGRCPFDDYGGPVTEDLAEMVASLSACRENGGERMNGQGQDTRRDCRECRHAHDKGQAYPHGCLLSREECRLFVGGVRIVENWETRGYCAGFVAKEGGRKCES